MEIPQRHGDSFWSVVTQVLPQLEEQRIVFSVS
jgi:predicted metal-dependent hydrolase